MSRYIDADKLSSKVLDVWKKFEKQGKNCYIFADIFVPLIVSTPTEEVTPIIWGKWIKEECTKTTDLFRCSRCGRSIILCKGSLLKDYPYCHCGTKMKEVEE